MDMKTKVSAWASSMRGGKVVLKIFDETAPRATHTRLIYLTPRRAIKLQKDIANAVIEAERKMKSD